MSLQAVLLAIVIGAGIGGGLLGWAAFIIWLVRDLSRSQVRTESDAA